MANGSSRSRGRRGGVKRPAAVSGPGKLARRTDGAAPTIEDVRGMVNESAGEEAALVDQVRQGNIEQPQTTWQHQRNTKQNTDTETKYQSSIEK